MEVPSLVYDGHKIVFKRPIEIRRSRNIANTIFYARTPSLAAIKGRNTHGYTGAVYDLAFWIFNEWYDIAQCDNKLLTKDAIKLKDQLLDIVDHIELREVG